MPVFYDFTLQPGPGSQPLPGDDTPAASGNVGCFSFPQYRIRRPRGFSFRRMTQTPTLIFSPLPHHPPSTRSLQQALKLHLTSIKKLNFRQKNATCHNGLQQRVGPGPSLLPRPSRPPPSQAEAAWELLPGPAGPRAAACRDDPWHGFEHWLPEAQRTLRSPDRLHSLDDVGDDTLRHVTARLLRLDRCPPSPQRRAPRYREALGRAPPPQRLPHADGAGRDVT